MLPEKRTLAIQVEMPNAKMLTYVKDNTIGHTKGRVVGHLSHIQGLIKTKPRTFSELFLELDSDKTWAGGSKQTVKSILSGTLYALRKNGAIKDCVPPKELLLDSLKAATAEVEAKRAERRIAQMAARKAANKERYKKQKVDAQIKDDQQTAEIQGLKDKLAISDANAQAAIERADKAEAELDAASAQIILLKTSVSETETELQETVEEWRMYAAQVENLQKDASIFTLLIFFNLVCVLISAYFLAFPGTYTAMADKLATSYNLALENAPVLYQRALDFAKPVLDFAKPILDYASASVRPVLKYGNDSAKPIINFILDI